MNDNMLKPAARTVINSRLTCAQCERMILDAMEDTLGPEDRTQFDLHVAACPDCSRAMADAQRGVAWLEVLQAAPPEPPGELLERILAQTSGDALTALPLRPRNEPLLAYGSAVLPGGQAGFAPGAMAQFAPLPRERNWLSRLLSAVMQPRFAMTTAMAFFSIAITMNLTGVSLRDLHGSSLKPANVRHSFWTANARVVRYYENLRVVYELESRVRELQRNTDDSGFLRRNAPDQSPNSSPDPAQKPAGEEPGSPQRPESSPVQPGKAGAAPSHGAAGSGKSSSAPSPGSDRPREVRTIGTALVLAACPDGLAGFRPQAPDIQQAFAAEAKASTLAQLLPESSSLSAIPSPAAKSREEGALA